MTNKTEALHRIWYRELTRAEQEILEGSLVPGTGGIYDEGRHLISLFDLNIIRDLEAMVWLANGRKFYPGMARHLVNFFDQINVDWDYMFEHDSLKEEPTAKVQKEYNKVARSIAKLRAAVERYDAGKEAA